MLTLLLRLSPGEHSLKNVGYGILKYLYKELQLDIFWRTRTWNLSLPYNIEELFRYMVISRALYPNCTWNEAIEKESTSKNPEASQTKTWILPFMLL